MMRLQDDATDDAGDDAKPRRKPSRKSSVANEADLDASALDDRLQPRITLYPINESAVANIKRRRSQREPKPPARLLDEYEEEFALMRKTRKGSENGSSPLAESAHGKLTFASDGDDHGEPALLSHQWLTLACRLSAQRFPIRRRQRSAERHQRRLRA